MICPYVVTRQTIRQTVSEWNDEGQETGWMQVENNVAYPIDCARENCGAFYDGRCRYNAGG